MRFAGLKAKRQIILGLASSCAIAGIMILLLSVGTDHWREKRLLPSPDVVYQGLRKECLQNDSWLECRSIGNPSTMEGQLHQLTFWSILVATGSLVLSLLLTLVASCSQHPKFYFAVTATEIVSGLLILSGLSVYTHIYSGHGWKLSWSYIIAWLGLAFTLISFALHVLMKDVKFFGKKMLTATVQWSRVTSSDPV